MSDQLQPYQQRVINEKDDVLGDRIEAFNV